MEQKTESEIVVAETYRSRSELPAVQSDTQIATSPMAMIQQAVAKGASLEQIQMLMDLSDRFEQNQARKAYFEALAAFKADPPQVVKNMENKQFGSRYASIEAWLPVIEALGKHGLSSSWEFGITPDKRMQVTCILRHSLGHCEKVTAEGPPDTSGKKNPLQEMKSTRTYLRIETLEAVTGLTSSGAALNDDGNSYGAGDVMDEGKLCDFLAAIEAASTKADVGKTYLVAIQEASELKDQEAQDRLNTAKNSALERFNKK